MPTRGETGEKRRRRKNKITKQKKDKVGRERTEKLILCVSYSLQVREDKKKTCTHLCEASKGACFKDYTLGHVCLERKVNLKNLMFHSPFTYSTSTCYIVYISFDFPLVIIFSQFHGRLEFILIQTKFTRTFVQRM